MIVAPAARADVVDEAFLAGNAAAEAGDWAAAVARYEEAERLLPGRSAILSFNLGTAHAQLGQLGPASLHLRRALQPEADPSDELADAARRNLGIVRQRMEVARATAGAQIDRPETWWELLLAGVGAPVFGWLSLACGWLSLGLWVLGRRLGGRGSRAALRSLALVLLIAFAAIGGLHGLALRAESSAPQAIVLPAAAEVREAPGAHRRKAFVVQGGARVRIVDHVPGWSRIRLSGGLEGWVPQGELGELRRVTRRTTAP
ncbi:MAG: SH3 domain-containing protein [Nannocystaceae bacterium]